MQNSDAPEGYKVCRMCKQELELKYFYTMRSSVDGKHYYCTECCLLRRASERVRKRDKKSKISVRQVYRAKGNGSILVDTTVTLTGIFIRDRGICQICKTKVTARQASMDHIKPIIKHGNHTWDNIQLTHLKCNLKKGDKYENGS